MAHEKKSFSESALQNWNDFLKFLWDSEKGTVLGRNANSWTKILIFYLFYYGFLAALFAISITIVRGTLDPYTPTILGVGVQPKIPSDVQQTSDIFYTVPKPGEDTSKNVEYTRLVDQITTFLKPYNASLQTRENLFTNCSIDEAMQLSQQFSGEEQAFSCAFNTSLLGPCGTEPYGYDTGEPCLYIKLNRIINWFPVGYTQVSDAKGGESQAPDLEEVLAAYGQTYRPYLMYSENDDRMNLNSNIWTNNKYYPEYMGMPFAYYPYHGKKRQPTFVNPLVAVQLTNITRNVKIDIACKVYALNIQDNKDMGEGFFRFDIQVNE